MQHRVLGLRSSLHVAVLRGGTVDRYAAKLLFQFRVKTPQGSSVRRICEERIVLIQASSASEAITGAEAVGRRNVMRYENSDGNTVFFEFVGILELLRLGVECDAEEVWYDIVERVRPMERRSDLLPPVQELHAVREERASAKLRKSTNASLLGRKRGHLLLRRKPRLGG